MTDLHHDRQAIQAASRALTRPGSAPAPSGAVEAIKSLQNPWGADAAGQAFATHYLSAAERTLFNSLERSHQLGAIGELLAEARQRHQQQEDEAGLLARGIEEGPR